MKAVILIEPNKFEVKTVETPSINDDEILLKVERTAICGTDIRILEGKKTKDVRYPSVIGHEISGTIYKTGQNVDGYEIGERVSIAPVIPCHRCNSCLNGRENACTNRVAIGYQYDGGFAEYVKIPKEAILYGHVLKLPEDVSFEEGALMEPLSCCIRGMKNAGTGFNDKVLIVGAGPIGLMHLQLAKIAGASKVIVSEPNDLRREKALKLGADIVVDPTKEDLDSIIMNETENNGLDVIILAIGVPSIINSLLKLCKKGGTLNLFAGFAGTGEGTIESNLIHYNEITVNGSTAFKRKDYLDARELVINKKINLECIVTHIYGIDEFKDAYDMVKSGQGLKVLINPQL